jgi:hypothetical protein
VEAYGMDAERLVPRSSGNRHAVAFWARWRREADPLFPRFRRSARGRGRLLPRGEGSQERGWRDNFKPFEIQFEEILVTRDEVSGTRLHCRSDDVVIVRIATHTRNLAGLDHNCQFLESSDHLSDYRPGQETFKDILQLGEEFGAGDQFEGLPTSRFQDFSGLAGDRDGRHDDVGVKDRPQWLATALSPVTPHLFDCRGHCRIHCLLRGQSGLGGDLFAVVEDPLPALLGADVAAKGLPQELASGAMLGAMPWWP